MSRLHELIVTIGEGDDAIVLRVDVSQRRRPWWHVYVCKGRAQVHVEARHIGGGEGVRLFDERGKP